MGTVKINTEYNPYADKDSNQVEDTPVIDKEVPVINDNKVKTKVNTVYNPYSNDEGDEEFNKVAAEQNAAAASQRGGDPTISFDPGPQVPMADSPEDPLGAESNLEATSIYNRQTTLMEELEGYVTPEGTVRKGTTTRASVLDSINEAKPENTKDIYDIDDMTDTQVKEAQSALISQMTELKTNEARDPFSYLIAGVVKTDLKLGIKLADGLAYAMAGIGDILIKDMEMAQDGTYGKVGKVFYEGANELLSGFGRYKKKSTPKDLVMGWAENIGALGESVGVSSLATGTASSLYSINGVTRQLRSLKEKEEIRKAIRNNVGGMEHASREAKREARKRASVAANNAPDFIKQDMIESMELKLGRRVSTGEVGNKVLDYQLMRDVGRAKSYEAFDSQTDRTFEETMKDLGGDGLSTKGATDLAKLDTGSGTLYEPIMIPENMDALMAMGHAYFKEFKGKRHADGTSIWNEQKNTIENLWDITVRKDIVPTQDLVDQLNEFGMSFEDYAISVLGDISEAGRILQKASQIGKLKPLRQLDNERQQVLLNAESDRWKMWQRIEGMRKGIMVSQFATTARNFQSTFIRAPLEGLFNVVDSALVEFDAPIQAADSTGRRRGGFVGAGQKLVSADNWKRSFRLFDLMYNRPDVAADMTDLILKNPKMASQAKMFYERINDIQEARGKGSGTIADKIVDPAEDLIQLLNVPNTMQEMMTRKATFVSELERLVKDNYDIDLVDAMLNGKLPDLMNDATLKVFDGKATKKNPKGKTIKVRRDGKPSFATLVDQATYRSLQATYAGEPSVPMLKELNRFIGKYGTLVEPFSRFLFVSMEFMGQSAGGASIPFAKKMLNLTTLGTAYKEMNGPMSTKDRERISRNIVGMATVFSGYQALKATGRLEEEAEMIITGPTNEQIDAFLIMAEEERIDIKEDKTLSPDYVEQEMERIDFEVSEMQRARGDGVKVNMTAVYPFAQFKYLSQAAARLETGTFQEKFDWKLTRDLFLSSSLRSQGQFSIIKDFASVFDETDMGGGEEVARFAGVAAANYLKSWMAQGTQLINAQRVLGYRPMEPKELNPDRNPSFDWEKTLIDSIKGTMDTAGFTTTPQEEFDAPFKSNVFKEEGYSRGSATGRLFLGVSSEDRDTPDGEYLTRYGIDYKLGSQSRFTPAKLTENAAIRIAMPDLVQDAKQVERNVTVAYDSPDSPLGKLLSQDYRDSVSRERHIYYHVNKFLQGTTKGTKPYGIAQLKKTVRDQKWSEDDLDAYQRASLKYRRLPASTQKAVRIYYLAAHGYPNMYDEQTLNDLLYIAKNPEKYNMQ